MMNRFYSKYRLLLLSAVFCLIASPSVFGSANVVIINRDDPGEGFNDTTPATPVGGNHGTTVGQQRLIAFQYAAGIWGATLTSGPTINIGAEWSALPCSINSGTLGSSSNNGSIWRDFQGAVPGFWYGNALTNALRNIDSNGSSSEIEADFNSSVGTTGCLQSAQWYYGLDTNHTSNQINLVAVILHEFAHGLGFQTFTNRSTGQQAGNAQDGFFPSIYDRFLLDNTTGKTWPQMNNSERVASAINTTNLVWNGPQVHSDATFLSSGKDGSGRPQMHAPSTLAPGSSVSHWSSFATPNLLMEPSNQPDVGHAVTTPQDLTFSLLRDLGWCAGCPQPPPPPPPPPAPANDNFANAQVVSGCSGSVTGTNVSATKEAGEPSHSPDGDDGGGSVWYVWQAPSTGNATFTTAGSNYDTLLAVYTGNSVNGLTSQGKNDDVDNPNGNLSSSVTFLATAGTTYRIAVDGWGEDFGGARGNITLNWSQNGCVVSSPTIQLSATSYSVNESTTGATATISRSGDTSAAATVDYFTSDTSGQTKCEPDPATGLASERCDYQTTVGTVTIPAGQTSVNISIPIVNDVHVEGAETFSFTIRNAVGVTLSSPSTATITITDNDTVFTQANPIDTFPTYVRQQYLDFLSREPDQGGFDYWMGRLQTCSTTPGCDMVRERKMVSAGFFYSNEFLLRKGYFIYRFYAASLGRRPTYAEFIPDMASMGQNDAEEEAKRIEFMNRWVTRADFVAKYPASLTHDQFVQALLQTAGLNLNQAQFAGKTRAEIVRMVVESPEAFDKFFKEAFISMQYFGYLRRDPDSGGYQYWFDRLPATRQQIDANPDLYIYDMVGGFVYSTEYQLRFGNRNY